MSQLLQAKRLDIQLQLEKWARKESVLKPGERLVFSLAIESGDAAHNSVANETLLKMATFDFFVRSRFISAGVTGSIICRAMNVIKNERYKFRDDNEKSTLRGFLADETYRSITQWVNAGHKTADAIERVLRNAGLELRIE